MTNLDFKKIIKKGEGINVEFKSSNEFLTDSIFETVVSFLNTIGGSLSRLKFKNIIFILYQNYLVLSFLLLSLFYVDLNTV